MSVHPLAVVSPDAQLAHDVEVGPFCVIEAEVRIGAGCRLESGAIVKRGTTLGANNHVCEGAVIGGLPQHSKRPPICGETVIGQGNVIREHVTIHCGLMQGKATTIGDNNLLMAGAHVGHDCTIGSNIVLVNNTMLAGHVVVEDRAFLSGAAGVHQHCRIGRFAMVGGQAHIVQDVPPFVTVDGHSSLIVGLNNVGLRRAGFATEQIAELKAAYRVIYRSGLRWVQVLELLRSSFPAGPAAHFHEFLSGGTRGFIRERRVPPSTTLKLREAA